MLIDAVDDLVELFIHNFGTKYMALDEQGVSVWAGALYTLQITEEQFNIATTKSLTLNYPPSCPKDFYDLGQPEGEQYPSASEALKNAVDIAGGGTGEYMHVVVYAAATEVGSYDLRNMSTKDLTPLFNNAYKTAIEAHKAGKLATQEAPALTSVKDADKPHVAASPEVAVAHIVSIKQRLGMIG